MKTQVQKGDYVYVINYGSKIERSSLAGDTFQAITNVEYCNDHSQQSSESIAMSELMSIAHEIKNPLNNIYLSNAHLSAELSNPDLLNYLDIIERSSKRINELVTRLLHNDSTKGSPLDRAVGKFSMNDVVMESLLLSADRSALKGVSVVTKLGSSPFVEMDKEKIKIALNNIIVNAIEAVPNAGGCVEICTRTYRDNCSVTIRDNGGGISRSDLKKIFEPSFTRKENGSGIGLAVTKEILDAHHAQIRVKSTHGHGTTFQITLRTNGTKPSAI